MAALRLRVVARFPHPGERSPFIMGSIAAHAALVGTLALLPLLARGPRIPEHAIVVELVGALAGPARATSALPQPQQQPVGPKAPAADVTRRIEPPKPTAKLPKPKAAPAPSKPKPQPPPAAAPAQSPAPAHAVPGPAGPPLAPGGASITALETGGAELAWYRSAVIAALHGHWQRPLLEGTTEPIEVAVAFEILRDGSVRDVRIEQESGVPSLDRSALRAVSDSAPLPPLPSSWDAPTLTALYVFRFLPE